MAVSADLKEFVIDLFGPLGGITTRPMMGGLCIYSDGKIFAIVGENDQIYIKAKGALADDMAAEGCEIFNFTRKDGSVASMGYWTIPDAAMDDPEIACDWARRALSET